jgi:hypothetical protein
MPQLTVMTNGGPMTCPNITKEDVIRFIQWMDDKTAINMYILRGTWGTKKMNYYFLKETTCAFAVED